jgi:hypothetical protein
MLEKAIVNVLFIFFKLAPENTLKELLQLEYGYAKLFKDTNFQDLSQEHIKAVKKLTALLELRYWQIIDDSDLVFFYDLTFIILMGEDRSFALHPYFLRLHMNVIKDIWVKIFRNKTLPINPKIFENNTRAFKNGILNFLIYFLQLFIANFNLI